jgi:3-phosphoshikimate 1-carboxyvinyltransferase
MVKWLIKPSCLKGVLTLPSSKSHTVRALLFALMANDVCVIDNPLFSPDLMLLIEACRKLGAQIEVFQSQLRVKGCSGHFNKVDEPLYLGNSGIALRFLTALLSLSSNRYTLAGDESLCQRQMTPLFDVLKKGGVYISSSTAPFAIQGPFQAEEVSVVAEDSQYLSALLMMAPFTKEGLTLYPKNVKERPYIEITLKWLQNLGLCYFRNEFDDFHLPGNQTLFSFQRTIAADFSTLMFPLVGALLTKSELIIRELDFQDVQGDRQLVPLLQSLGADIQVEGTVLKVKGARPLKGGEFSLENQIDALPILALLGCYTETPLTLKNIEGAALKECDRPKAVVHELTKMGAKIELNARQMTIYPSKLKGASLFSYKDHRMALMLAISGLVAEGESEILSCSCAEKTFPNFPEVIRKLGAMICTYS